MTLRISMLHQMRVHGFHDFVYGYHWDRLFHNLRRTFVSCFVVTDLPPAWPCMVMLASLLAKQNLYFKATPRPHSAWRWRTETPAAAAETEAEAAEEPCTTQQPMVTEGAAPAAPADLAAGEKPLVQSVPAWTS